ncbi:MAG: inositol monophosphatase [Candidatus Daviesbacteria bacterium]|nr:inositol monophosphatase [Candidatus Daviesbacteria bacterium]
MNEDDFLKIAKQAAKQSGLLIRRRVDKKNKVQIKNNDASNLVTEADLLSEKKIIKTIKKYFRSHNIISEEAGREENDSEYTWVIDPLDGTVSFAHNMPHFSVAVGLLKDNQPIVGVIYNVMTNKLYWAEQGKGAFVDGKAIKVSKIATLDESAVILGFGSIKRRSTRIERYVSPLINKVGHPYSLGSGSTSYTFVANGFAEATTDGGWLWDFVAGAVIVREAGGKVTDFEGKEPDWTKERLDLLASNGLVHNQILEALKP